MIAALLGTLLLIVGGMMLTSIIWCFVYDESWHPFAWSAGITILFGIGLRLFNRKNPNREVRKRDGYLIVALGWLCMALFGSLPYLFSGVIPDITNAFFETMSGFTTTGATILTDIEAQPKSVLYWRSLTHWIGGMGIIVLTIAILPLLGVGGMQLFVAESPGVTPDKLHPRITETAKRLWIIYFLLTLIETTLLHFGGMTMFDAINHAMATMATGGFSTQNASIAAYNSPFIQYVIIIFMFFAGINFTLVFMGFTGKVGYLIKNEEFRIYALLILIASIAIGTGLIVFQNTTIETGFRNALFQVVSIVTTTGFVTDDYEAWPSYLTFLLFILFFTGGSTGSTAGGIKIMRHIVLIKNSFLELKRQLHPSAVIPVRFNGKSVQQSILHHCGIYTYLPHYFLPGQFHYDHFRDGFCIGSWSNHRLSGQYWARIGNSWCSRQFCPRCPYREMGAVIADAYGQAGIIYYFDIIYPLLLAQSIAGWEGRMAIFDV